MPDNDLLVPSHARDHLHDILTLDGQIEDEFPARRLEALPLVLRALEIAVNGYRRVGFSSGQLQELERITLKLMDLTK